MHLPISSAMLRTAALYISVLIACSIIPAAAFSADISLSWERPDDSRITGYNIYYGISGDQYRTEPKLRVDYSEQTSVQVSDLLEYQTYDFSMTSVDAAGNESEFSEEVTYTVSGSDNGYYEDAEYVSEHDEEEDDDNETGTEVNCFINTLR